MEGKSQRRKKNEEKVNYGKREGETSPTQTVPFRYELVSYSDCSIVSLNWSNDLTETCCERLTCTDYNQRLTVSKLTRLSPTPDTGETVRTERHTETQRDTEA